MTRPFSRAIVDIAKLREYCLSEQHMRGRHKARVFRSRLRLRASDAGFLRQMLLEAVLAAGAENLIATRSDRYGQRFIFDVEIKTNRGSATVRSGWILRAGEDVLRFVTCFVC